jgi:hypothetical protein
MCVNVLLLELLTVFHVSIVDVDRIYLLLAVASTLRMEAICSSETSHVFPQDLQSAAFQSRAVF